MTSESIYHPHPDVLFTALSESEGVLLSLRGACYFALNETGSRIWQALEGGATIAHVALALEERYDVEPPQASEHTRAFLEELVRADLVRKENVARA